jgi:parallel beta-helix repeat protein
VRDATYNENVDVNKRLTIQSENGSGSTIIQATNLEDHVFEVTADHVNIHGFTVRDATEHWNAGIYLSNVNHCTISDNNVSNNCDGIRLYSSSNNTLTSNNVSNNDYGIEVRESNDNNIFNNNVSNTTWGIHLYCSSSNIIINNRFGNDGIFIRGDDLSYYNTHVIENNKLNGKPIYYYKNANAIKVPEDAGEVIIANCSEITVENINASLGFVGIELAYTNNSQITNNKLSNNYFGFYLYFSNENTLAYNNASNNDDGIVLWYSNNNILTGNKASNNSDGFQLYYSSNSTLTRNNVSNNDFGISPFLSNSTIYLNNFINNIYNLYSYDSANTWNSTELITYQYNGSTFTNYLGNYWDDHKEKYPDAEEIDGTGIWNMPYSINSDNDTYPLMEPWENYFAPAENIFDTEAPANPYPSIMGNHTGTIKPNRTISISKLYTYPCVGAGGHTEYAKIYNDSLSIETLPWNGYKGDWHNLSFSEPFKLYPNVEYNYTIRTGSYPQVHHNTTLLTTNGWINCTSFVDANGKEYDNWIPAIKLE